MKNEINLNTIKTCSYCDHVMEKNMNNNLHYNGENIGDLSPLK